MPRTTGASRAQKAEEEDPEGRQGLFRRPQESLQDREGCGREGLGARLQGSKEEEAQLPGAFGSHASMRAAREHELSYSRFMNGLKESGIEIDRRALADLAVRNPQAFGELAGRAKETLAAKS